MLKGDPVSASYDTIVVGLGAMGSAAVAHLAARGQRVLGLEMFQPGHDQGSSHGYHRMIRTSSLADDGYVPLAERAFALWRELEAAAAAPLLKMTGEVWLFDAANRPELRDLAARTISRGFRQPLSERDLAERFPGFRLEDGMQATHEAQAGYLRCEPGILAHLALAARHGATIRAGEEVTGWRGDGDGILVTTRNGTYAADRLVLTTGPWAAELLRGLDLPMRVGRRVNGFFRPTRPDRWSVERGAPDFLLDVAEGSFYGMPAVGDVGVKIGLSAGEMTTARTIRRDIDDAEIDFLRGVLDRYLPGANGPELRRITCMCTYTPDHDFIIDCHPDEPRVVFACGFSGRGYKFAPVIGEILADLITIGESRHDITFLRANRFASVAAAH